MVVREFRERYRERRRGKRERKKSTEKRRQVDRWGDGDQKRRRGEMKTQSD